MRRRLGDLLLEAGVLTEEQLSQALEAQRHMPGRRLGGILAEFGFSRPYEIAEAVAKQLGLRVLRSHELTPDEHVIRLLPFGYCQTHGIIPIHSEDGTTLLAMSDPSDMAALDFVRNRIDCRIEPAVASEVDVTNTLARIFGGREAIDALLQQLGNRDDLQFISSAPEISVGNRWDVDEAPYIKIVSTVLADAIEAHASDIHIEPRVEGVNVRFRVDGQLRESAVLPSSTHAGIISRIKVMADMDITERRAPQDGHIKATFRDRGVDFRVSTLPTAFGEKAVLRILDKSIGVTGLHQLGMNKRQLTELRQVLDLPQGSILITGPTGSGKTTTLYAALEYLTNDIRNIVTIEDPVERYVPGINQVQVNEAAGVTFATGLRSIVRQDPDVVMVGEIRDHDTAEIAMRAALTGHLVLSTVHTNDTVSTFTRLIDIGIDPYLIASSVTLIGAQRLVRRLCPDCRVESEPLAAFLERAEQILGRPIKGPFYKAEGCDECYRRGYKGRIAVFELLPISDPIRQLVAEGANELEILKVAQAEGLKPMFHTAMELTRSGETAFEEVLHVVPPPKGSGYSSDEPATRAEDGGDTEVGAAVRRLMGELSQEGLDSKIVVIVAPSSPNNRHRLPSSRNHGSS